MPPFATLVAPAHWRAIDFIADLHLSPEAPDTVAAWRDYLARIARPAPSDPAPTDALFILGDLFEAWVGDDAIQPGSFEAGCMQALRQASERLDIRFMPGNRDFLVGTKGLAAAHMQALDDPTVLRFGTGAYLLTHGDWLCTGDVNYQRARKTMRDPAWIEGMLARSLPDRQVLARQWRKESQAHQAGKPYHDVEPTAVPQWLDATDAATLIHGHTHRPGDHPLGAGAHATERWQRVLSDWHVTDTERRAQILRLYADGRVQRLSPEAAA